MAERRGAFGARTGWWAGAARLLALVLALAVAIPTAGLADDLTYHRDHPDHDRTEWFVAEAVTPVPAQAADPGLAYHVHCGCHAAVPLDTPAAAPPVLLSRPSYAPASVTLTSVVPDRLPRPPRA